MIRQSMDQALQAGQTVLDQGRVATYIPELGKADRTRLGICICTRDGNRYCTGDVTTRFSIQSISKVISLAVALEMRGFDTVFQQVGMEPSGDSFNSLLKLEVASSHPYNPMINSGAIAVCSYLQPITTFEAMLELTRRLCLDDGITLDEAVYRSEMSNISRNRAIAYLLESKGVITSDVEKTLEFYVKMCSLRVTAQDLAVLGLVLANGGMQLSTRERLLQPETVRVVKTIMLTCGMYDGSGQFAVQVGIPTKSGVGGGLLSVVEQWMGIGIYGPSLDEKGNSIGGIRALEVLSEKLRLHMFG